MKNQEPEREYVITKTVTVEYYFNIKAKSLRGAKQRMRNMEDAGDLTFEDSYQWVSVEGLEVEEVKG